VTLPVSAELWIHKVSGGDLVREPGCPPGPPDGNLRAWNLTRSLHSGGDQSPAHLISIILAMQVKSKDIFQSVRELLCQGFEAFKCPPEHSPDCTHQKKKDDLEDLADDFAKVVELNRKAPGSLEDMDKELDKDNASTDNTPTPASPGSLDMSAFFSPQNGSSSDDQETESDGDYEDLLCG
jgi:hypothetical protein